MAAPRNDNVKEKILDAATGLLNTQTFADISLASAPTPFPPII